VAGGQKVKVGEQFETRRLDTPLDKIMRSHGGRRSQTRTNRTSGRYVQSRPARGDTSDIAFDATLRTAAPYQKQREKDRDKVAFVVKPDDYMKKSPCAACLQPRTLPCGCFLVNGGS